MRQVLIPILFLGIIIQLFSCSSEIKYDVQGEIGDCDGCAVEIYYSNRITYNGNLLDSTIVINNRFSFKGTIDTPGFYDITVVGPKWFYPATVYLDTNKINITYDINQMTGNHRAKYPLVQSQSKIQKDINNYMHLRDSLLHVYDRKRNNLHKRYRQSIGSNDSLMYRLADSIRYFRDSFKYYYYQPKIRFAEENPSSIVSPYVMLNIINKSSDIVTYQRIYYQFTTAIKDSKYGRGYLKKLNSLRQHSRGRLGEVVSVLHGKSPKGDTLNVRNILKKNKIVFIDFWASWCGSCRLEMPKIERLYQKYHAKGFDVISISLDKDSSRWVKAIKEDNLPFHNISELKGAKGIDEKRFDVLALPDNIILNTKGEIIASYIRVDSLKKMLNKRLAKKEF